MILPHSLPDFKTFLRGAHLPPVWADHALAFVAAFLLHLGPMTATQAAGYRQRHVATLTRFLAQLRLSPDLLACARAATAALERPPRPGDVWVFAVDATNRNSQTRHTENTFSCGNRNRRPRQSARKQLTYHRRAAHSFVCGLLLTPGGLRLPYWLPYYTRDYCRLLDRPYRTHAELAAQLVSDLEVPAAARVVVVGDTAFEAAVVRRACGERGFRWVAPANPERVLTGRKPRRKLRAVAFELSERSFEPVRLPLDGGPHRRQRRVSAGRTGLGKQTHRTYWVHRRTAEVHSVGAVVVLFSNRRKPPAGQAVAVDKVLLSDAYTATTEQLLAWYSLRWQIELWFKELKGTLGLDQYRLSKFVQVEGWVQLCLVSFCYLEWQRARQLRRAGLPEPERRAWERARAGGLVGLLRRQLEQEELGRMERWLHSRSGRGKLRRLLRAACEAQPRTRRAG